MGAPTVELKWCVCNFAVPLSEAFQDPYGEFDDKVFRLLSLKATAKMQRLLKPLRLPSIWRAKNSQSAPLVQEALEPIRASKTGSTRKLPKQHEKIISVDLRGRSVFVRNDTRFLEFAVAEGEEKEFQDWLLKELSQDLAAAQNLEAVAGDAPEDPEAVADDVPEAVAEDDPEPDREDRVVSKALETLVNRSLRFKANYLPSRNSFKVKREDAAYGDKGKRF